MAVLNMSPYPLDITGVRSGDDNKRTYTLKADGIPWDLTGYTLEAQARKKAGDPTIALSAEIEILDSIAGKFSLAWPGDDVEALLQAGTSSTWTGVWDLQALAPSATYPRTIMAGKFSCESDVTR